MSLHLVNRYKCEESILKEKVGGITHMLLSLMPLYLHKSTAHSSYKAKNTFGAKRICVLNLP